METKICSKCNIEKPLTDFHRNGYHKDGSIRYRGYCKDCANIIERNRYWEKKNFIDQFRTQCAKCGENRYYLLDFHHKDPNTKDFTIGKIDKGNKDIIKQEIDKCVVLCSNCHREYHYLEPILHISTEEYLNGENWFAFINKEDRQKDLFSEKEREIIEATENSKIIKNNKILIKYYCKDCNKEITSATKTGLCMECYSKSRRIGRPTREELKDLIRTTPFTQIAKMYNVTDNAIRKWCDAENLPRKVGDIKKYTDKEWALI